VVASVSLVVGVALWAAPTSAQITGEWWPLYVANGLAPGEGVTAIPEGGRLCPPNTLNCTKPSHAWHHIPPNNDGTAVYATHALDVRACNSIRVRVKEVDDDTTVAQMYLQAVLDGTGTGNTCTNAETDGQTYILVDINGDGVINATDEVPMDGDDGTDSEGDGTARQTGAIYDVTGEAFVRLCVMRTGGAVADLATDNSYADIGCR
jgi:hypothetical protein